MRTAVAVAVLTMLVAPAASAQTVPDLRPPDAFLASSSGEVRGELQAYCWFEPAETGQNVGVCTDRFDPIDPAQALVAREGELLTLRFDRPIRPDSIRVIRRDTPTSPPSETFSVPADDPTRFRADFPPGTHILAVGTAWPQGDAGYVFKVVVRPAASGFLPPAVFDAIARLSEAARHVGAGDGLTEQRVVAIVAQAAALVAAIQEASNNPTAGV